MFGLEALDKNRKTVFKITYTFRCLGMVFALTTPRRSVGISNRSEAPLTTSHI
jgi:hypothetical protein